MKKPDPTPPLETQSSDLVESAVQSVAESGPDEINRLRDILFGSQTRSLNKRLGDLETRLETARQEAVSLCIEKIDTLTDSTSAQLAEARSEFDSKLTDQGMGQSAQLRAVQKEAKEALEKLAADLLRQIQDAQRELSDRLDTINADQNKRTQSLQSEIRQRDDGLRQEFMSLTTALEDGKVSRQDLGQILMELGLRLQQESENP